MAFLPMHVILLIGSVCLCSATQFDPSYVKACIQAHLECSFQFAHVEPRPFFGLFGKPNLPFTTSIVPKQDQLVAGNFKMGIHTPQVVVPFNLESSRSFSVNDTSYKLQTFEKDVFFTCPSGSGFETSLCHRPLHSQDFDVLSGHCIRIKFAQFETHSRNKSISERTKQVENSRSCVVFRTA